jgi:3-oxoacyl-[acyl-carrier protein] reductase
MGTPPITDPNQAREASPVPTQSFWPDRFKDQVILVTGAAGGLGSDTARRLVAEGARVVCTDVRTS